MKIGFIAHGVMPIPPRDWGAVEGIVWQYKCHLERLGHTVDIANTRFIHEAIFQFNIAGYDFVHCHCERFVLACLAHLTCPFAVTCHNGSLSRGVQEWRRPSGFRYLFSDTLAAPANIVLSERIRDTYLSAGYQYQLYVLRNAVDVNAFRLVSQGNGKAVCVGAISARKRQRWLATITRNRVAVDFVGPRGVDDAGPFEENETAKYLGVWDRPTILDRLTDYSCLVLLSRSEAAPLAVLEALAAGVSIVISEACAVNLVERPFITVIPDDTTGEDEISEAIQRSIDQNTGQRDAIRRYAQERFDYATVVQEYLGIVQQIRDRHLEPGSAVSGLSPVERNS